VAPAIKARLEDREVRATLKRARAALADLRPAMRSIGEYLLEETENHFRDERDADGRPWTPLKVRSYAIGFGKKKKATHTQKGMLTAAFESYLAGKKILTESHELRGSIRYIAGKSVLLIGSNKPYAAIHQFGGIAGRGRKVEIPARPFIGIGPKDRREILGIVGDYVAQKTGARLA